MTIMIARYPGQCRTCRRKTKRGDTIGIESGWRVWCEDCARTRSLVQRIRKTVTI